MSKTENRRAIVIGISQYESEEIPHLAGAENDGLEIHDQFKNNGNFEISPNHYLVGHNATRRKILKAVSEIFRTDTSNCDLVAFYFSGYGVIDRNNVSYIAPYDMDPDDPFVTGINMEDLINVIDKSRNTADIILYFDFCIARLPIEAKRLIVDTETRDLYASQLQKMIKPQNQISAPDVQRGKIILASSEATAISREKNNCIHLGTNEPHPHGVFTFYLIEGLNGKAADADTGIITIGSLRRYVEFSLMAEGKQKPIYYIGQAYQLENLKLAISQMQFNVKITQLIESAKDVLERKYPNSDLLDIQYLADAAKKVGELISLDPRNREISRLQNIIDDAVKAYLQPTSDWLSRNMEFARPKINEIEPGLYDFKLPELVLNLSFSKLQKIDQRELGTLIHLGAEIARNTEFNSEDDPRLRLLQAKLRASAHSALRAKASY